MSKFDIYLIKTKTWPRTACAILFSGRKYNWKLHKEELFITWSTA